MTARALLAALAALILAGCGGGGDAPAADPQPQTIAERGGASVSLGGLPAGAQAMTPTKTMVAEARTALRCYTAGDLAGFDLHRLNARRIALALTPPASPCLLCGMSTRDPYHAAACAAEQARIARLQENELQTLRIRGAL